MKIVIDIDEEMYKQIKADSEAYVLDDANIILIENAIYDGAPLPKGHGRLISVDDLLLQVGLEDTEGARSINQGEIITMEDVDRIPTIIESDSEVGE